MERTRWAKRHGGRAEPVRGAARPVRKQRSEHASRIRAAVAFLTAIPLEEAAQRSRHDTDLPDGEHIHPDQPRLEGLVTRLRGKPFVSCAGSLAFVAATADWRRG
jgi:hypothetical protein